VSCGSSILCYESPPLLKTHAPSLVGGHLPKHILEKIDKEVIRFSPARGLGMGRKE
jgi:hypothetical protein